MPRRPTTVQTGGFGSTNPAVVTSRSLAIPSTRTPPPSQPREYMDDRAGNAVQEWTRRAATRSGDNPLQDGNFIPGVSFTANTPTPIKHYLGRAFVDAIVMAPVGGVARFQRITNSPSALDSVQITLQADATVTAGVYVF